MFPELTASLLIDRAGMLQKARDFFARRSVLEVDCCGLRPRAPIDANIDVISGRISDTETGFLHTSPEYAMKELLAFRAAKDIYFLGHVFRKGDLGPLHNPEFTMAEWYRQGISFEEIIAETCEFLFLFIAPLPIRTLSYRDAFIQYAGLDYAKATLAELKQKASTFSAVDTPDWNRDTYVHFLLSHAIEPHLGKGELTVLTDYPPHEAALAAVVEKQGELVAQRFEIYCEGIEMANGYQELANALELRRRFEEANELRQLRNQETYLLDEPFLRAMEIGFPPCCGVSVGFDRAMMLRHRAKHIREVLPFAWENGR